jgi:hypothetical protein
LDCERSDAIFISIHICGGIPPNEGIAMFVVDGKDIFVGAYVQM